MSQQYHWCCHRCVVQVTQASVAASYKRSQLDLPLLCYPTTICLPIYHRAKVTAYHNLLRNAKFKSSPTGEIILLDNNILEKISSCSVSNLQYQCPSMKMSLWDKQRVTVIQSENLTVTWGQQDAVRKYSYIHISYIFIYCLFIALCTSLFHFSLNSWCWYSDLF